MSEWLDQARALRDRGNISQAISLLEEAIATGADDSAICKELARLSLTVNEVRAFANWCHEAMRIDPSDPEPHIMIGRRLFETRRWAEAAESLAAALRLGIADPQRHDEAASLLSQAKSEDERRRRENPGYSNL